MLSVIAHPVIIKVFQISILLTETTKQVLFKDYKQIFYNFNLTCLISEVVNNDDNDLVSTHDNS